jgi:Fe-S-cluster containining protein
MRYLTLEDARALECNGCGDCCDSRRTGGYWTWGELPEDQYRPLNDGRPLIIPLERVEGGWQERHREPSDAYTLSPTRFRCDAFRPQADGRGLCGIHDRERPPRCDEFPVKVIGLEDELTTYGEVALETSAFPRCTWYEMTVVREGDPRLTTPVEEGNAA